MGDIGGFIAIHPRASTRSYKRLLNPKPYSLSLRFRVVMAALLGFWFGLMGPGVLGFQALGFWA